MPKALGRVIGVLELEIDRLVPPQWVRVVTSIPGREGAFSRVWSLHNGRLEGPEYLDMVTWIDVTVLNAVEVVGGVQLTLQE